MSYQQPQWGPATTASTPEANTEINFEAGENCADVLIEIPGVAVTERYTDEGSVVAETVLRDSPLTVISMMPSTQELDMANDELGLPPGTLSSDSSDTGKPLVFILVGEYKLPIGPHTVVEKGPLPQTYSYFFPNFTLELTFPNALHADDVEAFDFILFTYGRFVDKIGASTPAVPVIRAPKPEGPQRLSLRIASRITSVAGMAASGILAGGKLAASGLSKGTGLIIDKTRPRAQPLRVSATTRSRIERTRVMTKGAVLVSSGLASSLVGIAAVVGNTAGKGVLKRVLPEGAEESAIVTGALDVGGAVIGSGLVLFAAAGDAGKEILTMGCDGATRITTHRLGAEAGEATASGLGVVQNVYEVKQLTKKIGVKKFAKSVAKESIGASSSSSTPAK